MAYFAFMGIDRIGSGPVRERSRDAHRAHLRTRHADCTFVSGGPLLDTVAGEMVGSLLIFEAASRADVERVIAGDPYILADLFVRTELHVLHWTVGAPPAHAGSCLNKRRG
ncbi:hypothetical protein BSL82_04415 [Tardibacter chloracetimidivorans]|uniref:YCII-related domain-containing protein n=1 Tax=Tardibacter chloracetimidivorans TaxID=1921510 RepID=A0A1L3ZSQ6_9SPHN|nr:hypothetical protein BSL82_04415 [Tardibacter chloracetimidivorans]